MLEQKLILVTMGGTIDAALYPEEDHLYPVDATMTKVDQVEKVVGNICAAHAQRYDIETIRICKKDSKYIDDTERAKLYKAVTNAPECRRIIVTMGTDTMRETALDLKSRKPELKCPVVFTGAIWPLANGEKSDGWLNLDRAIFAKPGVENGIYIAMGDIFAPASWVYKDFENKIFFVIPDGQVF